MSIISRPFILKFIYCCLANLVFVNAYCEIRRYLDSSQGLHRTLKTLVKLRNLELKDDLPLIAVVENVTSSFYIDTYQTDSMFKFDKQKIYSPYEIDLEGSEPDSISHEIILYNSSTWISEAIVSEFTLPFHVRYHKPQLASYFKTIFPEPKIFVETHSNGSKNVFHLPCKDDHIINCSFVMVDCEILDELKLMVPTGIESHYFGVLVITCIIVFVSMMWISFGMFGKL